MRQTEMELYLNNIINFIENKGETIKEELIDFFPKANRDGLRHFIETGEIEEPEKKDYSMTCTIVSELIENEDYRENVRQMLTRHLNNDPELKNSWKEFLEGKEVE